MAVAVATSIIAATVWFVRGRDGDVDVTQSPGAMKQFATVTTEAIQFYGGDVSYLQLLSRGRALRLEPVGKPGNKAGAPPLVSRRACLAFAFDEGQQRQGGPVLFYIDEGGGEGSGYDRLYVDRNADGVFEADEPVGLMADPPPGATVRMSSGQRCLVFEPFGLQVRPDESPRPVVARLGIADDGSPKFLFVGEVLRCAKVTLGAVECSVFLRSWFPGNYDDSLARQVIEYGPARIADYWRGNLWSINGAVYRLSPASRGETLTVDEYVADAGTIAVGLDGAWKGVTVEQISVGGTNPFLIAAGPLLAERGEFQVPAGRYYPVLMSLKKGAASCFLMDISGSGEKHVKRVRVSRGARSRFVMAARPEVTFIKPAKSAHVRPGDHLEVEALMRSPEWGLCVRGISVRSDAAGGNPPAKQLQPQVVVKDSAGSVVAQGPMPFG